MGWFRAEARKIGNRLSLHNLLDKNRQVDYIRPMKSTRPFLPELAARPAVKPLRALSPRRLPKSAVMADPTLRADLTLMLSILRPRRASGSRSHLKFLQTVIEPVFGAPDKFGNYAMTVGTNPTTAFTAHHDTVEFRSGEVGLFIGDDLVIGIDAKDKTSTCLGADDGAGIWLILNMIAAGVPGVYLIFADEESGLQGSAQFAWTVYADDILAKVKHAVAFDRHDKDGPQVITHMIGQRTASDRFAAHLSAYLPGYKPSADGSITDTYSLIGTGGIREVTNISAAYQGHHTERETLDFAALRTLRDRLLLVDWSRLPADMPEANLPKSDPWTKPRVSAVKSDPWGYDDSFDRWSGYDACRNGQTQKRQRYSDLDIIQAVVEEYPHRIAMLLADYGLDVNDLADAIGLERLPEGR